MPAPNSQGTRRPRRWLVGPNVAAALLALLAFVHLSEVSAQPAAATVSSLRGEAVALSRDGVVRGLSQGAEVYAAERIQTRRDSAITLEFADGSVFDLGADATMRVDRFSYRRSAEEDSIGASVLRGVFRFVSGLIARARPRSMQVQLSVATIGIRGTQVTGEVGPDSATVILLEPQEPGAATAIEVSNAFGSVVVDQPGWGTEIPDANSPPSPPRRMGLQTIQNLTRTIQQIQRIRPPQPRLR
ncbi:MAG: FecR domain-containing protein [Ectothiorhodospiraceae bacterium]|nr:FecR domain-containing protein [Chromatiales bacterium]MCP5157608.1 FecR domain-containing protein [Ectothiorhodospiraceae bacterium]